MSRLVREAYGPFELGDLTPGEVAEVDPGTVRMLTDAIDEGVDTTAIEFRVSSQTRKRAAVSVSTLSESNHERPLK